MASRPPPITTGNINVQPFNPQNLIVTPSGSIIEKDAPQPITITNQQLQPQPFNPQNLVVTSDRLITERQPVTITTEPLKTQPFNPNNLFFSPDGTLSELKVPPPVDPSTLFVEPVSLSAEQQLSTAELNVAPTDINQVPIVTVPPISEAEYDARLSDGGNFSEQRTDWRVKLALAPESTYLYNDSENALMKPIRDSGGVIFPYTPSISVQYSANYSPTELVHSNYKVNQYSNSSVDSVNIVSEFTAQDEFEARYVLAVIHFFRSVTKMFYGQDENPLRGTPPPLCYLYGMGSYQFSAHPLVITGFTLNLPNNVDYFPVLISGKDTPAVTVNTIDNRLGSGIRPGGLGPKPNFAPNTKNYPTWVPTKLEINIQCLPIMSRTQVSNNFSVKKYATGELTNGTIRPGGGFW